MFHFRVSIDRIVTLNPTKRFRSSIRMKKFVFGYVLDFDVKSWLKNSDSKNLGDTRLSDIVSTR